MHFSVLTFCLLVISSIPYLNGDETICCERVERMAYHAMAMVKSRRSLDQELRRAGLLMDKEEIAFSQFLGVNVTNVDSERFIESRNFLQTLRLVQQECNCDLKGLEQVKNCLNPEKHDKEPVQKCYRKKYRTVNGKYNSILKPDRGTSVSPYGRILRSFYSDNIHALRKSVTGDDLPNPRSVSSLLNKAKLFGSSAMKFSRNTMELLFAQFIAHDGGLLKKEQIDQPGTGQRCCSKLGKQILPRSTQYSSCCPIKIDKSDPIYSKHNVECLNFIRTQTITESAAEKVNFVNNFLDLSLIYGNNDQLLQILRTKKKGQLKTNKNNVLLENSLENKRLGEYYLSGDTRVNQTPFLALIHSLFKRHHNRVAKILASINVNWDEETLFQETRRLVIAQYQHITYYEWLPIVLGQEVSESYGLICNKQLYCANYDEKVDPTTTNEFSAAIFRFYHLLIPNIFNFCDEKGNVVESKNFSDTISKPQLLEKHYDSILRGLLRQRLDSDTEHEEVMNFVFKNKKGIGLDLIATDIHRGRDHGLAPYHEYRELCNLPKVESFDDLRPSISSKNINILMDTYSSVADIDLLVGASLEKNENGIFGPTLTCLIAEQFYRFKMGDAYFYNHYNNPYRFTPKQLTEIKKFSFAKLLCDNSNIDRVPENPFLAPCATNKMIYCDNLPDIDYEYWTDAE